VIAAGRFNGSVNFGGSDLTSAGGSDIWLAKFGETPTRVVGTPGHSLAVSAYPNPFNPQTTIRYDVPSAGRVVVSVYDAMGARVATLVDRHRAAGSYTAEWEGRDERGAAVSSGVYFVRVEFGGRTMTRKLELVK
jgi:hypothetical protein